MKTVFYFTITLFIISFLSCSDDITSSKMPIECKLISYTDSVNYLYTIDYENKNIHKLTYYKFNKDSENILLRTIIINRNFFDEINYITYTNKSGILEGIDSVFFNSSGNIDKIIHYNGSGYQYGKEIRIYNKLNLITEENSYKYIEKWILTTSTKYEYDDENRVIKSIYELKTESSSNIDTTTYTYDNMKNIESKLDFFTVFTVNNKLTATTNYTLKDGSTLVETKYYDYVYNSNGYPIKVKITSSINSDDVKYKYFNFDCPK